MGKLFLKLILAILSAFIIFILVSPAFAKSNIIIIFDASGSMKARINRVSKMVIAKEVVGEYISTIPANVNVGLIVYGHRRKGDCKDVEYIVPCMKNNRHRLISTIKGLKPIGKTPITRSLVLAVKLFKHNDDDNYIILVSDGKESCHSDPCGLIENYKSEGKKFIVHVIGFSVNQREGQQLKCIADSGQGKYFPVKDIHGLKIAFENVKNDIPLSRIPPEKVTKKVKKSKIPFVKGYLNSDKPEYVAGSKAVVTFKVKEKYPDNAWLGIVPSEIPHGDEKTNDAHDITYKFLKGKMKGSFTFNVPGEPGSYDFRLNDDDHNGNEIASLTFKVIKGSASVILPKKSFVAGEPFNIKFSTKVKLADNAWVGIVPSEVPHGSEKRNDQHDIKYSYLKGEMNGTRKFNAPSKPGNYDIRMNDTDNNGTEIASTSFKVTIGSASVSTDKDSYTSGEKIIVSFKAANKLASNAWVGIVPSEILHGSEARNDSNDLSYKYLNKDIEGIRELNAPAKPGQYDIRLNDTDNNGNELCYTTFTVYKPKARLALKKTDFCGGEVIWVEFETKAKLNKNAWAGIIPSDIPHGSEDRNDANDLQYKYLNGKQTGWLEFVSPSKPGNYDIRLNDTDNNGNEIASVSFKTKKATASLSINKKEFLPEETIWVTYSSSIKFSKKTNAWIGILPADIPHGEEDRNDDYDISYRYIGNEKDGIIKFKAPVKPGSYDIRFNDSNSGGNELTFVPFSVIRK